MDESRYSWTYCSSATTRDSLTTRFSTNSVARSSSCSMVNTCCARASVKNTAVAIATAISRITETSTFYFLPSTFYFLLPAIDHLPVKRLRAELQQLDVDTARCRCERDARAGAGTERRRTNLDTALFQLLDCGVEVLHFQTEMRTSDGPLRRRLHDLDKRVAIHLEVCEIW